MDFRSWLRALLNPNAAEESVASAAKASGKLAYSHIRQGDYVAARDVLLKALSQRDKIRDVAVLNWLLELLSRTWTATDQYRDKAEFFSQYLSRYPADVRAYTLRAGALWDSGELDRAVEDYSTALTLNPGEILARLGRGQVYADRGDYRLAIDDLDFVQDNLHRHATAHPAWKAQMQAFSLNGRALAHGGLGDFEQAMADFDRSISLCPNNAWVYFNRAKVYEKRSFLEKAVADYIVSVQKKSPKLCALKREYAEVKIKTLIS